MADTHVERVSYKRAPDDRGYHPGPDARGGGRTTTGRGGAVSKIYQVSATEMWITDAIPVER